MAKNNVKKKPTAKQMASAIIEINNKTNELYKVTKQIDNVLGLYIEMKGDKEPFGAYVDKQYKKYQAQMEMENDKKKNGKSDSKDIPEDSKNKGRRTEGVRKEAE